VKVHIYCTHKEAICSTIQSFITEKYPLPLQDDHSSRRVTFPDFCSQWSKCKMQRSDK